ncbi:pyruvate ferredoxin oxidoreductase [Candidatus Bathyarchaeota archaeon]|nr:pyruvate ferredoxin oxidoreductase [Candidatus Bathyarchaeota archaeon]
MGCAYTGNEAVAYAAKQCNVDVVAAYPITPQTIIVERFSDYVANGEVDTKFMYVESEHSAMSACVGASLAGARVFTSTASQGLALMHEVMYLASGLRTPIVMGVVNRALSAPINIHGDHSDMMGSRDCGWIQLFAENAQEAYDLTIQAFKIAEDPAVQLPVAVNLDGYTVSHATENMKSLTDEDVARFLPPRKPIFKVDPSTPISVGGMALPEYYYEIKRQQEEALRQSRHVVKRVGKEYGDLTGRRYGFMEAYAMEDAQAAVISLGSTCGTVRSVAKRLRAKGKKVGAIKLWMYRPFPAEELISAIKGLKALAVMDRAISFGAPYGALCSDISSSLQNTEVKLKVLNMIYGLGGRDIPPATVERVYRDVLQAARTGKVEERVMFLDVRE